MGTSYKKSLVYALIALIALIIVGCTRSASTAPAATDPGSLTIDEINQRATMDALQDKILTQSPEPDIDLPTEMPTIVVPTSTDTPSGPTETPLVVIDTPIPSSGEPQIYIVQQNEWIYSIARKFGISADAIIAANNLQYPYDVFPGDELIIPSGNGGTTDPGSTPVAGGTEYTVQTGDWVGSIARKFEVTDQAIIEANNLVFPYIIYPGDVIYIP